MQLIQTKHVLRLVISLFAISGCSAVAFAFFDDAAAAVHAQPDPTHLSKAKTGHWVDSVVARFKDADSGETPDFQKHVAPLLGRLGCNGRACHGSFQGQGGFQLSLFGYDFEADHQSLLEDGAGRVDLDDPEESLVLTKPTSEYDHDGGLRYEKDSWQFNLLKSWITSGGKTPEKIHKLQRLVVQPNELQLSNPANTVGLKAIAHWADGSSEDVTPLCRFHSNDDSIAKITETGQVSTDTLPGDTHVVVSYDSAVVPVPVIHPYPDHRRESPIAIMAPTRIDQLVAQKWDKLNIEPSELSDDSMFLRRVSIDVTGTLPAPDEIREFLADSDPDKRSKKIDELLQTPAYSAWWSTFFCDMTENNTLQLRNISYNNNSASQQWYDWIHQRVEQNVPYDEMIAGIVTGVSRLPGESYTEYCQRMTEMSSGTGSFGDSESMPYYWMRREFQDRDTRAISFAHAFLGLRIQCASCHKHPFDRWSQDDFQEFAKFFGGVSAQNYGRARTPEERAEYDEILKNLDIDPNQKNRGNIRKQLTDALKKGQTTPFGYLAVHAPKPSRAELQKYQQQVKEARKQKKKVKIKKPQVTEARLLGSGTVDLTKHSDIRQPVMDWMRRPDNPYFAKALVNRVWAKYFGAGIIEPADDLNLANPPSNAPLLDYLASEFINHNYDLKWLHREIANSRTYQLSWVPNETNKNDRRNFSRALPRRLPAEVVFDAVASAASNTSANRVYRDSVDGRAISIPGTVTNNYGKKKTGADTAFALKVFGRSERASSCDCDRSAETSLIQTVYMQNDRDIHAMLTQKNSWINQMAARHQVNPAAQNEKRQLAALNKRVAQLHKSRQKLARNENQKQARRVEKQIRSMNEQIAAIKEQIAKAASQQEKINIREVVTEAYLRTLSRLPTEEEIARCETYIREGKDLINGVTGVMWALVNTKEFIVNH